MRDFDPATAAFLATRPTGISTNILVWIVARDRVTGAPAPIGFWNGADHETITVEGQPRAYFGAATLLGIDSLVYGSGLEVRNASLSLAAISPEVEQAVRGYDTRLAAIEVHRILWDAVLNTMQGPPHLILRGQIDAAPISTPAEGGSGGITVSVTSSARSFTRTLALRRDDESQRRRNDDRIRRYATLSGVIPVKWGEK